MIVRLATRADVPELARVHTESAEAAYAHVAPPEPNGLERRTANWLRVFDDAVGSPHVAEADGDVVGILNFGPAREQADVGELYVLYVLPTYWGRGAAQLLIVTAQCELARRHDEAVLSVLAENPRARRFYERNGWELQEIRVEPHFGGAPTEIARYRKVLTTRPRGNCTLREMRANGERRAPHRMHTPNSEPSAMALERTGLEVDVMVCLRANHASRYLIIPRG